MTPHPLTTDETPFYKDNRLDGVFLGRLVIVGNVVDLYARRIPELSAQEWFLSVVYGTRPSDCAQRTASEVGAWTVSQATRTQVVRALATAYLRAYFVED